MPQILTLIVFLVLIFWISVLTFILWKQHKYNEVLMKGSNRKTLPDILDGIIKETELNRHDLNDLSKRYDTIEKEGRFHIQKIGLLRFNPFKDTGGDQSFILTLVDAHDTGVIISGLYSRSGMRWYAKRILKGKAVEHDLSDDEKKALKLAQPISHQ